MQRTTRNFLALTTACVAIGLLTPRPTQAHKKYMIAEGLTTCGYCHTKDAGGGTRNYRGAYYATHARTFTDFDDAAAAKAAGAEVAPHAELLPATAPLPKPGEKLVATWEPASKAMMAYTKTPDDAAAKSAYVTALVAYTHATWTDDAPALKRSVDTMNLAHRVLVLDPMNASATADLKAASDLKAAEDAKAGK